MALLDYRMLMDLNAAQPLPACPGGVMKAEGVDGLLSLDAAHTQQSRHSHTHTNIHSSSHKQQSRHSHTNTHTHTKRAHFPT